MGPESTNITHVNSGKCTDQQLIQRISLKWSGVLFFIFFLFHLGYMADSLQSYNASLYMSGVVIIVGAMLLFLLKCFYKEQNSISAIEIKILPPSDHVNISHQRNLSNGTISTNVSSYMVMVV